jgi:hypothetical protein
MLKFKYRRISYALGLQHKALLVKAMRIVSVGMLIAIFIMVA